MTGITFIPSWLYDHLSEQGENMDRFSKPPGPIPTCGAGRVTIQPGEREVYDWLGNKQRSVPWSVWETVV